MKQLRKHTCRRIRAVYDPESLSYMTNEQVFQLCQQKGDSMGSLKLAVVLS
jgi:hypothetical protein